MEYPILPLVEFNAIVFLQALATMSSFVVVFSWNVICKLKEFVEDYAFNLENSIWKIRFCNCTCKQTQETSEYTLSRVSIHMWKAM